MYIWICLFVRNQNLHVPSGGNELGYCFVFCSSFCVSDSLGPGYCLGGFLLSRAGCEGGLNLSGFSRTIGLEGVVEAYRQMREARRVTDREVEGDEVRIARNGALPRGRRNRGMVVAIIISDHRCLNEVKSRLGLISRLHFPKRMRPEPAYNPCATLTICCPAAFIILDSKHIHTLL